MDEASLRGRTLIGIIERQNLKDATRRPFAPEVPYPPAGEPVRYCSINDDGTPKTEIPLHDSRNSVTIVLGQLCLDYMAIKMPIESKARVTIASQSRPIQLWNNWVKGEYSEAKEYYRNEISISTRFYDEGHFGDKQYGRDYPNGLTLRECGRNRQLPVTLWPKQQDTILPAQYWLSDPLPTFDRWAHIFFTIHDCSGFCGLDPYETAAEPLPLSPYHQEG